MSVSPALTSTLLFLAVAVVAASIASRSLRVPLKSDDPARPIVLPKKTAWWPAIHDSASARTTAKHGLWAAFFCAGATAVLVILAKEGVSIPFAGFGSGALLDGAIMAFIGIGILNMSRVAAIGGLVLYIAEQIYTLSNIHSVLGLPIPIVVVIVVCFLNGIRGTFAFQKYR